MQKLKIDAYLRVFALANQSTPPGSTRRRRDDGAVPYAERNHKWSGPAIHFRISGATRCRRLVSRILFWTIIPLGDALLRRSSNLPAGFGLPLSRSSQDLSALAHRADTLLPPGEERQNPCLFGLAPCGVYHAAAITGRAVRSYRTISPLPQDLRPGAVSFLLHWP